MATAILLSPTRCTPASADTVVANAVMVSPSLCASAVTVNVAFADMLTAPETNCLVAVLVTAVLVMIGLTGAVESTSGSSIIN